MKINNLMCNFESNKGNFKSFKHILVYKLKETTTGVLKKVLKMVTSRIQTERRALENILSNSPDCLLAVAFRRNFSVIAPVSLSS